MGAFYGTKIKNGVINHETGEPWKIEDVPKKYRSKVEAWLSSH